jgi:hypothetical protein
MVQPEGALDAVQLNEVPVVVVPEAAKPLGAAGKAEQVVPPPPLLLLPPQEGRKISPLSREAIRIRPSRLLRRAPPPSKPPPISTIPTGSHTELKEACSRRAGVPAVGAVVWTVSVEVPEPPLTEVEVNEQVGAGVSPPLTLHAKFTVLLYPWNDVMVMVDVDELPAFTTARGEPAMLKSELGAKTVTKASGQGTGLPPPASMHVALVLPAL